MKILSANQIRGADQSTIANEPISSLALMERAAAACASPLAEWATQLAPPNLHVFCGPGNNGGDGMVLARLLPNLLNPATEVRTYLLAGADRYSPDLEANFLRLTDTGTANFANIQTPSDFPPILPTDLVVDCLFGAGLNRPIEGVAAALIAHLNGSGAAIAAIDIPSGLSADAGPLPGGAVIRAQRTFTFQSPKLSFLFDQYAKFVGDWEVLPIGLHEQYLREASVLNFLMGDQQGHQWVRPRAKVAHKGHFGHALIMAGSYGKLGAAQLAAHACLRTGVGLCTAYVPACGYAPLQTSLPEAMLMTDPNQSYLTQAPDLAGYAAIGIGPGLGQNAETATVLHHVITHYRQPLVLDADALNLLASHRDWLPLLPPGSILTPHPKEFARLLGAELEGVDRHQAQLALSAQYQICVVLKGAHTCTTLPNGQSYFNSSGNPGMAKAGSGDALTGMLTALLAQGYAPETAAPLGVYLHGRAGDLAAKSCSQLSMLASDLIAHIGQAYLALTSLATH